MEAYSIPVMGGIPSLDMTFHEDVMNPPHLVVKSFAPYKRFAIRITDDGLDSAGLVPGDFVIFREQRWPNDECQVCLIAFGGDATLRIIEGIYNTEPILRVNGDKIPPMVRHRNDFIVLGVLDGIVKAGLEQLEQPTEEDVDWGC